MTKHEHLHGAVEAFMSIVCADAHYLIDNPDEWDEVMTPHIDIKPVDIGAAMEILRETIDRIEHSTHRICSGFHAAATLYEATEGIDPS